MKQLWRAGQFFLALVLVLALFAGGCASTPPITGEMSEHMRQMAEMRDTCTQYAAWVARDFKSDSPEFKRAQQLYIEASASANSYIEALQFDVTVGTPISQDKYSTAAQRVHDSSKAFLDYAQNAVGVSKSRGLPLLIPMAMGLVEFGMKLHDAAKNSDTQQRELISKALTDKKWKPFNELTK